LFSKTRVVPNPSTYNANDGTATTSRASPALGAAFALLALTLPDVSPTLPAGSLNTSKSHLPSIVGGTLGGIFGLILVFFGLYVWLRKWRGRKEGGTTYNIVPTEPRPLMDTPYLVTPFEVEPNHPLGVESTTANTDGMTLPSQGGRPSLHEKNMLSSPQSDLLVRGRSSMGDNSVSGGTNNDQLTSSHVQSPSQDHDIDLRRELDELRRQMETLRGQQQPFQSHQQVLNEPPPMYVDESES